MALLPFSEKHPLNRTETEHNEIVPSVCHCAIFLKHKNFYNLLPSQAWMSTAI